MVGISIAVANFLCILADPTICVSVCQREAGDTDVAEKEQLLLMNYSVNEDKHLSLASCKFRQLESLKAKECFR